MKFLRQDLLLTNPCWLWSITASMLQIEAENSSLPCLCPHLWGDHPHHVTGSCYFWTAFYYRHIFKNTFSVPSVLASFKSNWALATLISCLLWRAESLYFSHVIWLSFHWAYAFFFCLTFRRRSLLSQASPRITCQLWSQWISTKYHKIPDKFLKEKSRDIKRSPPAQQANLLSCKSSYSERQVRRTSSSLTGSSKLTRASAKIYFWLH